MFAPLNIHSYYSIGWGTVSPEQLCQHAAECGVTSMAMTDTNNLYGMFFFIGFAKSVGIRPIVGAELSARDGRATLLVRDCVGYANLCRLITARHETQDFDLLTELPPRLEGLVVLTGCDEILCRLHDKTKCLYAELALGKPVYQTLKTARRLGVKPVATAQSFWINPEDYHLHLILRAIHKNGTLQDLKPSDCAPRAAAFVQEQAMREAFSFCLEAVDNTLEVADLCKWTPDFGVVYPEVSPGLNGSAIKELREKVFRGAEWRYRDITPVIGERIEHELELISLKGYAPVFLVVEDIVRQSPRTCGRGSAAASMVSYCLGITHVDPIKYNLYFERFINSARVDPPDIDVDFAWDERDRVLDYVFAKYGAHHSAMVSNHVTFQRKAAVHETAKVYGIPESEIMDMMRRMQKGLPPFDSAPKDSNGKVNYAYSGYTIRVDSAKLPKPWDEIFQLAERLEDIPRHLSVHCGGVVITPEPLSNWVPVETAAKGVKIIQWEKDQTEESGLVKIDLLGNRSLAVIRDALQAIRDHHGIDIDYATWDPLNDPETQALIARGDTMGVFYVESPATRLLQKRAAVGDYEHLVIHSSIIRPAANRFIKDYLRRLKGEPWQPLHPLIGDILDENYGIMVYQEDVSRVAMRLAGFDFGEADELRKIISQKHKHRRLADLMQKFYSGARERGVQDDVIQRIWEMIMSFAGYSFCKPHSASYALVSFKSAYLRAHFPAEFMAAVISNQGGYYATFAYVSEAKRMGLRLLPPDANESEIKFIGRGDWLRVGLMQIKGLPQAAMERLILARTLGRFNGFGDCIKRARLQPAEARLLVLAGCFDRLEPGCTRPELLWRIALSTPVDDKPSQEELFDAALRIPPKPPEYNKRTLLEKEVETLGFLISRHPLELYQQRLRGRKIVNACDLDTHAGKRVNAIGWLVTGKVVPTVNRELMEFVTFEDTTGLLETVFFPDVYRRFNAMLSYSKPYLIYGLVEEEFGVCTLTVERIGFL